MHGDRMIAKIENLNIEKISSVIESYNNKDTDKNILVKLDSIEFFKKNFKLKLVLNCLDIPEILDEDNTFESKCNKAMVGLEKLQSLKNLSTPSA